MTDTIANRQAECAEALERLNAIAKDLEEANARLRTRFATALGPVAPGEQSSKESTYNSELARAIQSVVSSLQRVNCSLRDMESRCELPMEGFETPTKPMVELPPPRRA